MADSKIPGKYNAGAETRETRQRFPVDSPATCSAFYAV